MGECVCVCKVYVILVGAMPSLLLRAYVSVERGGPLVDLPVLLDLERPVPLQVLVLVVVGEQRRHRVGAARHHAGRRLLERRQVALDLRLRRVRADHVRHLVDCAGEMWFGCPNGISKKCN